MEQSTTETVTTVLAAVPSVTGVTFTYDLTITAGVVVSIVSGLILWIRSRGKAVDDRMTAMDDRLGRHEARISSTEQTLNHMPAKDDLHALQVTMSDIRGELGRLGEAQTAANQRAERQEVKLDMVHEYLLNRDKK